MTLLKLMSIRPHRQPNFGTKSHSLTNTLDSTDKMIGMGG